MSKSIGERMRAGHGRSRAARLFAAGMGVFTVLAMGMEQGGTGGCGREYDSGSGFGLGLGDGLGLGLGTSVGGMGLGVDSLKLKATVNILPQRPQYQVSSVDGVHALHHGINPGRPSTYRDTLRQGSLFGTGMGKEKHVRSSAYLWFLWLLVVGLLVVIGLMAFGIIGDFGSAIANAPPSHATLVTDHTTGAARTADFAGYDTRGTETTTTGSSTTYASTLQTMIGNPGSATALGNTEGLWINQADIHAEEGMWVHWNTDTDADVDESWWLSRDGSRIVIAEGAAANTTTVTYHGVPTTTHDYAAIAAAGGGAAATTTGTGTAALYSELGSATNDFTAVDLNGASTAGGVFYRLNRDAYLDTAGTSALSTAPTASAVLYADNGTGTDAATYGFNVQITETASGASPATANTNADIGVANVTFAHLDKAYTEATGTGDLNDTAWSTHTDGRLQWSGKTTGTGENSALAVATAMRIGAETGNAPTTVWTSAAGS